jgi:hypothetical protein
VKIACTLTDSVLLMLIPIHLVPFLCFSRNNGKPRPEEAFHVSDLLSLTLA